MKTRILILFIIILVTSSCTTTLKTEHIGSDRLVYLDTPLKPGVVAWSPDSTRIAAIRNKKLSIFDTKTGNSRVIAGLNPIFLEWAPGNNLLIVHQVDGRNELSNVDADNEVINLIPLQEQPAAVKWLSAPDEFIVLSTNVNGMSIGTFVTYKLTRVSEENTEIIFNQEVYFPTRQQTFDHITGWTYAGIRPLHETVFVPEYHNPPRVGPYTLFKTIDPLIEEIKELYKLKDARFNIPSTWSPDGSHFAVTDSEASLKIINVNSTFKRVYTDDDVRGWFPSWNPAGSQLYIGGWIVESDGTTVEQLVPDARESMGIWSPDGTGLAILYQNKLYCLDGFSPEFHGQDRSMDDTLMQARDEIRRLKNLLRKGLINEQEFNVRRARLLTKTGMDAK